MEIELIDFEKQKLYSSEAYEMATDAFVTDYSVFMTERLYTTPPVERKQVFHKAKSGAQMLGLLRLSQLLEACEATPEDKELLDDLRICFKLTIEQLKASE